MIAFKCPHCGTVDERPDYLAGQKTVCSRCKRPGLLTGIPILPTKPTLDVERNEIEAGEPLRLSRQKEPWFYGFLETFTYFAVVIGILGAIAHALSRGLDSQLGSLGAITGMLIGIIESFAVVFGGCLFLILVDIGRSLRKLLRS